MCWKAGNGLDLVDASLGTDDSELHGPERTIVTLKTVHILTGSVRVKPDPAS